MDRQEEIKIKNQKAEEAMRRARQAQRANEKMQRELQAAARELARHQELARKVSQQEMELRNEAAAADRRGATAVKGTAVGGPSGAMAAKEAAVGGTTGAMAAKGIAAVAGGASGNRQNAGRAQQNGNQDKTDAALKQQEASREAARQAMIYEAAKRRAEKKEAARKAAELVAAQREAEKKVHHTSPETKELQNLLLQQVADIMEEKDPETVSHSEGFGDLVIMDVHGEELQPESSAALEKRLEKERIAKEQEEIQENEPEAKLETWGRMGTWFQTFCWMHIPLVGFWYMVVVALRKKTPKEKKAFARAYILYRILVLILACTILYIFYRMGLSFLEQILSYMAAHQ